MLGNMYGFKISLILVLLTVTIFVSSFEMSVPHSSFILLIKFCFSSSLIDSDIIWTAFPNLSNSCTFTFLPAIIDFDISSILFVSSSVLFEILICCLFEYISSILNPFALHTIAPIIIIIAIITILGDKIKLDNINNLVEPYKSLIKLLLEFFQ